MVFSFNIRFHKESWWPEWDSSPRPCVYRADGLTTVVILYVYIYINLYVLYYILYI